MNVLLSIKPEFAEKILTGDKQYEFRKTRFRDPDKVESVILYASAPTQEVVGSFTFTNIIEDEPQSLWDRFGPESGIEDRSRFMEYFSGKSKGYAIDVDEVEPLHSPVDPWKAVKDFHPPVSFQYVNGDFNQIFGRRSPQASSD